MKRVVVTLLTLLLLASPVLAQGAKKRIKFPSGRTTVILKGKATVDTSQVYVLRARKGQQMTLHLTSPNKNAMCTLFPPVGNPTGETSNVTDWSGELPQTGDYEIWVSAKKEGRDGSFTLEVTVR